MNFRLSFWWGAAIEGTLLLLAVVAAWILAVPLWDTWRWNWVGFRLGVGGLRAHAAPVLVADAAQLPRTAPHPGVHRTGAPSGAAGMECGAVTGDLGAGGTGRRGLVPGAVQGWIAEAWGPVPALVLASALFGICHWITPAYALIAGLMGFYLGGLWWWSGNLLTPVVAHAVYDFLALLWVLRLQRP
jgi:membrane protease YdiL (CAAX protease family)